MNIIARSWGTNTPYGAKRLVFEDVLDRLKDAKFLKKFCRMLSITVKIHTTILIFEETNCDYDKFILIQWQRRSCDIGIVPKKKNFVEKTKQDSFFKKIALVLYVEEENNNSLFYQTSPHLLGQRSIEPPKKAQYRKKKN